MSTLSIRRHALTISPDNARVILRSFIPADAARITATIGRALAMTEQEVEEELELVRRGFASRHHDMETVLMENYTKVASHVFTQRPLSKSRKDLIGALFSGEYAPESAALFNPSIVAHPDQSEVSDGGLRFIISLRATGEGHISSIEFREGTISHDGHIHLTPCSQFAAKAEVLPNPIYRKMNFVVKLHEMGLENDCARAVMNPLNDQFSRGELAKSLANIRREVLTISEERKHTLACIQWLADSNYELRFASELPLNERIIFPVSTNESNGIEDARFVRFIDEDDSARYYATYTAYNGHNILPQLIETEDFLTFRVLTLNGSAVQNKGMALFPRRINGCYAMLSRQDDENLFLMYSDNPHFWSDSQLLLRPAEPWEAVKVGNCGSPIETEKGWLVITHGVGAMRRYCIGAALLDLEDPTKVIGRLHAPLLSPREDERNGYVPNVVYSCGSLIHNGELILPYAMSDWATTIVSICLEDLLDAMR